jgi:hypothetical protein
MQNPTLLRKFLALEEKFEELKSTVHSKTDLPATVFTETPLEAANNVVVGKAQENIQQYMVVAICHATAEGTVPSVDLYDRDALVGKLYTLGVALEYGAFGDVIRIQTSGIVNVRIASHSGDTYGSATSRMFRSGIELKPKTGGFAEVVDFQDVENPSFISLGSNTDTDEALLVRILGSKVVLLIMHKK